jgi:hypothetical protein
VITAAAAIMFCVVASFVVGDVRVLKVFGLGLAVAVLVDAAPRVRATAGQPNVLDLALPHDEPGGEQHDHVDEEPGEAAGGRRSHRLGSGQTRGWISDAATRTGRLE